MNDEITINSKTASDSNVLVAMSTLTNVGDALDILDTATNGLSGKVEMLSKDVLKTNDRLNTFRSRVSDVERELKIVKIDFQEDLQRTNDRTNAFIRYIRITTNNVEDYIENAPWTERIFHWIRYREAKTRFTILKTILHACEAEFEEE